MRRCLTCCKPTKLLNTPTDVIVTALEGTSPTWRRDADNAVCASPCPAGRIACITTNPGQRSSTALVNLWPAGAHVDVFVRTINGRHSPSETQAQAPISNHQS